MKQPARARGNDWEAYIAQTLDLLFLLVIVLIYWLHNNVRRRTCEHLGSLDHERYMKGLQSKDLSR
jgi:hypothetical protein